MAQAESKGAFGDDRIYLEKFVTPEHHAGQVGFFRIVQRALEAPAMRALDDALDDTWRADRDYIIADMNGSAVFLFSILKMRVGMAGPRTALGDAIGLGVNLFARSTVPARSPAGPSIRPMGLRR